MNEPPQPTFHPSNRTVQPVHTGHAAPAHPPVHQGYPAPVQPPRPPGAAPLRPSITPPPSMKPPADDLEPIELIEEPSLVEAPGNLPPAPQPKKIRALGVDAQRAHHDWKRQTLRTGTGACRVRSFHGKYSEQGLEYLDNAINEWLDGHPDIEVKFVTSTVMTFEGKIREPALVLNVWY